MNDKASRIALVLVGLAVSALALKALIKEPDRPPTGDPPGGVTAGDGTSSGGDGTGPALDPLAGGTPVGGSATSTGGAARAAEAAPALERRDVGPPLADGTPVDVAVRFEAGTVTRYRITDASAQRDRQSGLSTGQRVIQEVTTRVTSAGDAGSARVRLTVDAVRIQAIQVDGLPIDFDSRDPDDATLENPVAAMAIKPYLVPLGHPLEFELGAHGGCVEIDGIDAWNDAWVECVEALQPGSSRQLVPPYTRETVLQVWSEVLFPPILGGTLKAGEERDVQILRDTLQNAYIEFRGPLRVTHDDGAVFRLRLLTKPGVIPRQGAARSPQEAAVARVHVQSDADAYDAAWRFERAPGRLLDAEIDTKYQVWCSWLVGRNQQGEDAYQPVFLDVERSTRVERIAD